MTIMNVLKLLVATAGIVNCIETNGNGFAEIRDDGDMEMTFQWTYDDNGGDPFVDLTITLNDIDVILSSREVQGIALGLVSPLIPDDSSSNRYLNMQGARKLLFELDHSDNGVQLGQTALVFEHCSQSRTECNGLGGWGNPTRRMEAQYEKSESVCDTNRAIVQSITSARGSRSDHRDVVFSIRLFADAFQTCSDNQDLNDHKDLYSINFAPLETNKFVYAIWVASSGGFDATFDGTHTYQYENGDNWKIAFTQSSPTVNPTLGPTVSPTTRPSVSPSNAPTTPVPSKMPSSTPTKIPTSTPTSGPTSSPTTPIPSKSPSTSPTKNPTMEPTMEPTMDPTMSPTNRPSFSPIKSPTNNPTVDPTMEPTMDPTMGPTNRPSSSPSPAPIGSPTGTPTAMPSMNPTTGPTIAPTTLFPSHAPITNRPTGEPISQTVFPTGAPTTSRPSLSPTTPRPTFPFICPDERDWIECTNVNSFWSHISDDEERLERIKSKCNSREYSQCTWCEGAGYNSCRPKVSEEGFTQDDANVCANLNEDPFFAMGCVQFSTCPSPETMGACRAVNQLQGLPNNYAKKPICEGTISYLHNGDEYTVPRRSCTFCNGICRATGDYYWARKIICKTPGLFDVLQQCEIMDGGEILGV